MAVPPQEPPPAKPTMCYLREVADGPDSERGGKLVTFANLKHELRGKYANYQYSWDNKQWFTCARVDPEIEYEVFISHASEDGKKARELMNELKKKEMRVFFSGENLTEKYEPSYIRKIYNSIDRTLVFCIILSRNVYVKHENGSQWVYDELVYAKVARKLKVIPIRIDASDIHGDFNGIIHQLQQIRCAPDTSWQSCLDTIVNRVGAVLRDSPPVLTRLDQLKRWIAGFRLKATKALLVLAAMAAVVVLALFALYLVLNSNPSPQIGPALVVLTPHFEESPKWAVGARWLQGIDFVQTPPKDRFNSDPAAALYAFRTTFLSEGQISQLPRQYTALIEDPSNTLDRSRVMGIIQCTNPANPPTNDRLANILSEIGGFLEANVLRDAVNKPPLHDSATNRHESPHDPSSYVLVHVSRMGVIIVWPQRDKDIANTIFTGPTIDPHSLHEFAIRLRAHADRRGGTPLDDRIVILCGEVVAFQTHVYATAQTPTSQELSLLRVRPQGLGQLHMFHWSKSRKVLNELLAAKPHRLDQLIHDDFMRLIFSTEGVLSETEVSRLIKLAECLPSLVESLQFRKTNNHRDLVLAPFIL